MSPERFARVKGVAAAAAVSSVLTFGAISDVRADSPTVDSKNTTTFEDAGVPAKGLFADINRNGGYAILPNISSDLPTPAYCPIEPEVVTFVNNHSGASYSINKGVLHIDAPNFVKKEGDNEFFKKVSSSTVSAASSVTSERPELLTINLACIDPTQGISVEGNTIIDDKEPKDSMTIEFAQVVKNEDLKSYLSENFGIEDDVKVEADATIIALGKKVLNKEDDISFMAKETPDAIYVWPVLEQSADSHPEEHFETIIFSVANPLGKSVVVLPYGEVNIERDTSRKTK